MTPLELRGRTMFATIIALGTLTMLWLSLASDAMPRTPARALAVYGRPLVLVLLGVLAAHGRRWALLLLAGYFALLLLMLVVAPLASVRPSGGALAFLLALGALYGACAALLLRSPAIRAFLARPRAERTAESRQNPPSAR